MAAFNLSPGPEVGRLLAIGRRIYADSPVAGERLLDLIGEQR